MQTKGRFDPHAPEIKTYLKDLAGQFVREGTMVAFPTCLPGMTTPIPHEESRIVALDINSDGHLYGGTSGHRAHVFAAAFHGLTGIVLDAGAVPDCTNIVAVCCGTPRSIALANGSRGGRAVAVPKVDLAEDWIQEWGLSEPVLTDLGECVGGEPVVHGVCDRAGRTVVGVSTHHLFTVDVEAGAITVITEAPGRGRIAFWQDSVFGQDDSARLWRFDLGSGKVHRGAVSLPKGDWSSPLRWARDRTSGVLYTADTAGQLFSFDGTRFGLLGKTHLAPVGPMAVTTDGRLFGFCGEEMANLFCCDMESGTVRNLGVAASVIEKRRYGYQFGAAVSGPDGEIVFGEEDNDGHLWLYFPKARSKAAEG